MDASRLARAATPACMRGNVAVSLAYEQGAKWGAAGLSRDTNPYDPFNRALCSAWDEGWCDGWDPLVDEARAAVAALLGIES